MRRLLPVAAAYGLLARIVQIRAGYRRATCLPRTGNDLVGVDGYTRRLTYTQRGVA